MNRQVLMDDLKSMMQPYLQPEDQAKLADLSEDSEFLKDVHMDSIDMVDVIIQVEQKYGIEVKNETIAKLNTVGKCLDVIQEKLAEKV